MLLIRPILTNFLDKGAAKGVEIAGWETFDTHPDLILYEGYWTQKNQAHMERKLPQT